MTIQLTWGAGGCSLLAGAHRFGSGAERRGVSQGGGRGAAPKGGCPRRNRKLAARAGSRGVQSLERSRSLLRLLRHLHRGVQGPRRRRRGAAQRGPRGPGPREVICRVVPRHRAGGSATGGLEGARQDRVVVGDDELDGLVRGGRGVQNWLHAVVLLAALAEVPWMVLDGVQADAVFRL